MKINGWEQSCENNVTAILMMLDDQPIDGYFFLNMGGAGILVDLIGGVTITVTSNFSAVDPSLVEGETITLDGEQAFNYVLPVRAWTIRPTWPVWAASGSS